MHSLTSNFFTKCTVAFHFWKATVYFVFIKKSTSPSEDHRLYWYFIRIFSLSPLISSETFSLFFSFPLCSLCSLFSLCSFGGWFFGGWACRRGPGVAVPDPCRSGGHPSVSISAWPVPAVPMNSILQRKGHRNVFGWSPEFDFVKKGSLERVGQS